VLSAKLRPQPIHQIDPRFDVGTPNEEVLVGFDSLQVFSNVPENLPKDAAGPFVVEGGCQCSGQQL
jgi:hypothetical protein